MLAACCGVPHLYDMHSSLPQQLTNFAFSRSAVIRRVFLAIERLMIRRSRVVIVICPSLEETVRGIDPQARTVLIENAPGSADEEATPAQAAAVRRRSGARRWGRRWCSTRARSKRIRGSICCSRPWRSCTRTRPDARLVLAGGKPDQVDACAGAGARGGNRAHHDFRRRAPGVGDSRVPAGRGRARFAAIARDEHAAEDLSVSAVGKADRRDTIADAHAGAE